MSLTIGCEELAQMFGLKNEAAFRRRLPDLQDVHGFPRVLPGSRGMFPRTAVEIWMQNWHRAGAHVIGAQPDPITAARERFKADRRMRAA